VNASKPALVLAGTIITQLLTAPGQSAGVSVFVDRFVDDLHLTRSGVSAAYLIGTLSGAMCLPLAGRLIDRHGVRWAVLTFGTAFGAVLVAMAGVRGVASLALGFTGIRMLGQGALSLTASTTVAVSFDARRGTALGLLTALGGGGESLVPLASSVMIAHYGWRTTWVILGCAVWAVLLPLARWVIPDVRLRGAGRRMTAPSPAPPARTRGGLPASEVLRQPMFGVAAVCVGLSALIGTALIFHQTTLLGARGLTPVEAAANLLPQSLAAAAAALAAGRLADRVPARVMLPASMSLLATAPMILQHVRPGATAVAYAVCLGAAGASIRTVEGAYFPRWFGLSSLGELRGVVMAITVASSAVGPFLLSVGGHGPGGYALMLDAFAVCAAAAAVAAALVRPPDASTDVTLGATRQPRRMRGSR
jgi:MFS family permease